MVFPQLSVKEFLISLLVLALFGGCVYFYTHPKIKEVEKVREKPVIHEVVQKETINTVTAKEKVSPKDADLVVNTKDTVKVSINGKEAEIKPKTSSKYEYGKDYLEFNQKSIYTLDVKAKALEPAWGVGMGYTSNNKPAGFFQGIRYQPAAFRRGMCYPQELYHALLSDDAGGNRGRPGGRGGNRHQQRQHGL